jgi:pyridoxamine 5'-phosphate oxidase family protein
VTVTVRPTPDELAFLRSTRLLARLATVDAHGQPHVVPVGWSYDEQSGAFEVGGRALESTRKWRNAQANPPRRARDRRRAAAVRPRAVHVQGPAETLAADPLAHTPALIRLLPARITSWGVTER